MLLTAQLHLNKLHIEDLEDRIIELKRQRDEKQNYPKSLKIDGDEQAAVISQMIEDKEQSLKRALRRKERLLAEKPSRTTNRTIP